MAPKPKGKQFSFKRLLGLQVGTSSAPRRSELDVEDPTSAPARLAPSTLAQDASVDHGTGIVNIGPSPSQTPTASGPSFFANSSHFVVQKMKVVDASQHHTSGEG